jgi:hypothetical protein
MRGELGTMSSGAIADLLVVDGNPLKDIESVAGQGEKINHVLPVNPNFPGQISVLRRAVLASDGWKLKRSSSSGVSKMGAKRGRGRALAHSRRFKVARRQTPPKPNASLPCGPL